MSNTWGALSWSIGNFGAQNDSTVDVTGVSLTGATGSVVLESKYAVTGQPLTIPALGTVTFDIGASPEVSGQPLTTNLGTVDADPDANATGQSMTMALGTAVLEDDIAIGWGRNDGWNTFAWGIQGTLIATGQEATSTLNSVTTQANSDVDVTGQQLTVTQGEESINIAVEPEITGFSLTSNLGNLDANPDANATGQEATMAQGDTIAYNLEGWGRYFYGEYVWGATGIWANVDVTGISLSSNLGTLTMTGDANVDVTGQVMTAAEGNADADPDANIVGIQMTMALGEETITGTATVDLTGIALSANLGTAVLDANTLVDLTGFGLTMAQGSVITKAEANVTLTGIGLTASEGSLFTLIWNEVQTNSDAVWTEIDTAA